MENDDGETTESMDLDPNPDTVTLTQPTNPFHIDTIIQKVTDFLPQSQLPVIRQLNKQWNNRIETSRLQDSFCFKLDGRADSEAAQSEKMGTLLTSSVLWRHFEFKNMNFEPGTTSRALLEAFDSNYGPECVSLRFENCNLQMSDFFQVIANTGKLEELRVIECASIYTSGSHILKAWKHMAPFMNNMRMIKRLEIRNISTQHDLKPTIETWLRDMSQLEELRLCTLGSPMPNYVMTRMVQGNAKTLTTLSIFHFNFDQYTLGNVSRIWCHRLKHIELSRCNIEDAGAFADFLQKQKGLETISFENMGLRRPAFEKLPNNSGLRQARFSYCDFQDFDTLTPLKFCPGLQSVRLEGDDRSVPVIRALLTNQGQTVQGTVWRLEIKVDNSCDLKGTRGLIQLIPNSFPNLQYLQLSQFKDVKYTDFKAIFSLPALLSLDMSGSEIYCEAIDVSFEELPGFRNIQYMDLSATEITDTTVQGGLVLMRSLKFLNISGTVITQTSLECICQTLSDKLEFLDVRGCEECILSRAQYQVVKSACLPNLTFLCDFKQDEDADYDEEELNLDWDDTSDNKRAKMDESGDHVNNYSYLS